MKGVLKLLFASAFALFAYALLFALKRNLFPADIVLTEGLFVMAAFVPLLAGALFAWRGARRNPVLGVAVFVITVFGMLVFNLTVPAIFDRSVTLYLLNGVDNGGAAGMTAAEIREEFIAVYFAEDYAIRKRLGEQVHGGNLARVQTDGGGADGNEVRYVITPRGRFVMGVARWISRVYNLDPRIVEQRKPAP